jgi:hypothetical protein
MANTLQYSKLKHFLQNKTGGVVCSIKVNTLEG